METNELEILSSCINNIDLSNVTNETYNLLNDLHSLFSVKLIQVSDKLIDDDIHKIQIISCWKLGISLDKMLERTKKREIVERRFVAIYMANLLTNASHRKIGKRFGYGSDYSCHSSVNHAINVVNDLKETIDYAWIKKSIESIKTIYKESKNANNTKAKA
jgi:chromosomal replication initiation ATPase DnaA